MTDEADRVITDRDLELSGAEEPRRA